MIIVNHRINNVAALRKINFEHGVEVDLRDNLNGEIYLAHDPFVNGESFDNYLNWFNHKFIIINIKSEGIEYKVIELLKKHQIKNYFFLDSSFPMIKKLSFAGETNMAIRFSEFEGLDTIISMKGKIKWVWIDCFSLMPLTKKIYELLKNHGFELCLVSPELQNQEDKIIHYKQYLIQNKINVDMVCTKSHNNDKWLKNI